MMFRRSLLCCAAFCTFLISGCGLAETEDESVTLSEGYLNLNLKDAVIKQYTPDSGEWKELRYHPFDIIEGTVGAFPQIIESLGETFLPEEAYYIAFRNLYAKDHPELANGQSSDTDVVGVEKLCIPFAEASDMKDELKQKAEVVVYDTQKLYVQYSPGGRMKIISPEKILSLAGKTYENGKECDMYYYGTSVTEADLRKKQGVYDKAYPVGGRELSVREASEKIRNYLENNDLPYVKNHDYRLVDHMVEIKQYSDTAYGYIFKYSHEYDGVPLYDDVSGYMLTDHQEESDHYKYVKHINPTHFHAGVFTDGDLDYVWSSAIVSSEAQITELPKNGLVTYDEACRIVSEFLTPEYVFDVDEVLLQYGMVTGYLKSDAKVSADTTDSILAVVEPIWRFTISNPDVATWEFMYIYVEAQSGDVMLEYVEK